MNITLKKLINNKLRGKKDFDQAMSLIMKSEGIQQSRDLAKYYIEEAVKALDCMEDNICKKALIDLAVYTLTRDF